MCIAAAAIPLIASVASAGVAVYGSYQQGKIAETTARNNAALAEMAARDAESRGEKEAVEVQRKGAAIKSAQRNAMAARGLDLGYGTAADLQDQTDFFTQSDVATTRTNARKEAWSRRAQRDGYQAEAQHSRSNANLAMAGSLLGSASKVAGHWNTYQGG